GKPADALKAYTQARDIQDKLTAAHPSVAEYQDSLAETLYALGLLLQAKGKRAEARLAYTRAGAIRENLLTQKPPVASNRIELARIYFARASLYLESKEYKEGLAHFKDGIEHLQVVVKTEPLSRKARQLLWQGSNVRAIILGGLKRHREAVADWDRA